ncbi:MAG: hypothetical protein ACHQF0_17440 [Chitinophagales bacterium]
MRKTILILIFLSMIVACIKSKKDANNDYIELQVFEAGTNSPLENVAVGLYTCTEFDLRILDCTNYNIIGTVLTDAQGKFRFDRAFHVSYIEASLPKYWTWWTGYLQPYSNIYLFPESWFIVKLHKTNIYPENCKMEVYAENDSIHEIERVYINNLPIDTSIYVKSHGGFQNKVIWEVKDATNRTIQTDSSNSYQVNKFDSTSISVNY